jgi:hypothetical protein
MKLCVYKPPTKIWKSRSLLPCDRPRVVFDYSPTCSIVAEVPSELQYHHRTDLDGIEPAFSGGPGYEHRTFTAE